MTKNEERDIVEWALYHFFLGFDALLIFDNGSEDRTAERLRAAQKFADIRIFDWPRPYVPGHAQAFVRAAEECRDSFDWIALFDHDEFFVPLAHRGPKEYLASMDRHASIAINWTMYGSSGYIDYPAGLTTESFVNRAPLEVSTNRHVKSFLRPKEMIGCVNSHNMDLRDGVETVDSHGNPVQWRRRGKMLQPVGLEDTARFHHYHVRSRAHWQKKMQLPFFAARKTPIDWESYDRNDVYDAIVPERFPDILAKVRASKAEIQPT